MEKMKNLLLIIIATFMMSSCSTKEVSFKVLAPSGAPALAQIKIQNDMPSLGNGVTYEVEIVSGASTLPAAFTSQSHEIIYAPVNVGAKMYNNNQKYLYAANVTWGNLFFATAKEGDFTLDSLKGADVSLFGEGTINQTIVEQILTQKNITLGSGTVYESGTDITRGKLLANPDSIVLIAEPVLSAVTTALAKTGKTVKTISVQDLWGDISGKGSYPQAGIFVNKEFYDNNRKLVIKYLEEVETSCEYVNDNPSEASQMAEDLEYGLPATAILSKAIPNCNIIYKSALESKEALEYTFNFNLSLIGGALPDAKFYLG